MRIFTKHVQEAPPRLSHITELEVPDALEELLLRCLAKAPEDRPQAIAELWRGLEAVQTAQPWTQSRARAWWQRHFPESTGEPPPEAERASGPRLFFST